jgi:hypothetical protein
MTVGQTLKGTITMKNVGTSTWKAGVTKLAPTPRDKASAVGSTGWLSATRVSSPGADVAPGGSFAFPLELTANAVGDVTQTFSLVEEAVTWFGDAPLGGGPPDGLLAVHVVVTAAPAGGSSSSGSSSSGAGTGGAGEGGSGGSGGDGAASSSSSSGEAATSSGAAGTGGSDGAPNGTPSHASGCALVTAAGSGDAGALWMLGALGAMVVARRRRSASPRA